MTGFEEQLKECKLDRLADSATVLYAMSSALARANRGYCQGNFNAETEMNLAAGFILESRQEISLCNSNLQETRNWRGFFEFCPLRCKFI